MNTNTPNQKNFKRENRYVVFKLKDIEKLNSIERKALMQISESIEEILLARGKSSFEAVVIESDWPEYETVWQMIEARITGNSLASAPEVCEAVAMIAFNDAEEYTMLPLGREIFKLPPGEYDLYLSAQPDRTAELAEINTESLQVIADQQIELAHLKDKAAQLESQLSDRDEEIERLQSYEQGLNEVIAWMKERGLYWEGDYQQEGADFAAILTEHEQQVSAQSDRKFEAGNKRLVALANDLLDALKDSIEVTNSPLLFGKYMPLIGIANDALIAEMEAKG